jgi:diaminopimelate decarboxylase
VAAIEQLGLEPQFSHVSMGGGASITYLSGEPLPGIEALKKALSGAQKPQADRSDRLRPTRTTWPGPANTPTY